MGGLTSTPREFGYRDFSDGKAFADYMSANSSPVSKKRSMASQILCPLLSLGAFFIMLSFFPSPDSAPSVHEASITTKAWLMVQAASVFAVPIIVYQVLRRVF